MKKIILSLCLLFIVSLSFSQAQVSRNRLKQPIYSLINRQVPTNTYLDSLLNSMWNIHDDGVPTTVGNVWSLAGNTPTVNTSFIGTTNNTSFNIKTNNLKRFKFDSLGLFTSGVPTYTDINIWSMFQGSSNNYYQSIWQNTNNGNTASTDLVVSNDIGTATSYYGNFGINSSTFAGASVFNKPSMVYLTSTSSDLGIGTTTNNSIYFGTNGITHLKIDSVGNVYSKGSGNVVSNTAFGNTALFTNTTTGINNTAYGFECMYSNTTGSSNSALGSDALVLNVTGSQNTAMGQGALYNTNASNNTAFGYNAAFTNSTGINNTALGSQALLNSTVSANTAIGRSSLSGATSGGSNTAIGYQSGINNSTGSFNTWVGYQAGLGVTTGSANTFIGSQIASQTNTTNNNIILADGAGNIKYRWDGTNNTITGPLIANTGAITATMISNPSGAFVANAATGNVLALKINNVTIVSVDGSGAAITGTTSVFHLIGTKAIASNTLGAGAGTGATVTLTTCTDLSGRISITTAGTPTGSNATIITLTFGSAYTTAPHISWDATGANSAALSGTTQVFFDSTTTTLVLKSGSAGLTTGTIYTWDYTLTQ